MSDKALQTTSPQPERAPVIEHEQDVAPGVLAPGASLAPGDLPSHPTAQFLRRSAILGRQSFQGNQAVQRLLQRDTPAADPNVKTGLDPSMLKVTTMSAPASAGAVNVAKVGEGENGYAQVQSGEIKAGYGVTLDSTITIGASSSIKVGPVQTMTSSERVGIYKKDGQVVAEQRFSLGQTRDARPLAYKLGEPTFLAESPFYDKTGSVSDSSPTETVNFIDRPSFRMPLQFGGGQLAALRGADSFVTSVGAKRDGTVITMSPFAWKVDWTTELGADFSVPTDANGKPVSKDIAISEAKQGIAIDSPTVARDLLKTADAIYSFKTLDAAMATPASLLLAGLPAARRNDPASAALIEQALTQKNPTFQISATAVKPATHNLVMTDEDTLDMFVNITKQSANKGPFVFEKGHIQTANVHLNEIADIAAVNESSELSVLISGSGVLGETAKFAFPFLGSQTIRPTSTDNTGEYAIRVIMF